MRSVSGNSPVISMSIQTRLFWFCAIIRCSSYWKCGALSHSHAPQSMTMTASQFTTLFVSALFLNMAVKFWLAYRQLGHVARYRGEVPAAFRDKIDLAAHQKAADYTRALIHFGMLTVLFDAALLLLFTLGGGIQWLNSWSSVTLNGPLLQGTAVIVAVLVLHALLESPFELY